jgi:hypothetical protein
MSTNRSLTGVGPSYCEHHEYGTRVLPFLPYRSPNSNLGLYLCDLQKINPLNGLLPEWQNIIDSPNSAISLHAPHIFVAILRTSIYLMRQMDTINASVNMLRHCSVYGMMSGDDLVAGSGMSHVHSQMNNDIGSSTTRSGPATSSSSLPTLMETFDQNQKDNAVNQQRRQLWDADLQARDEYLNSLPEGLDTRRFLQFRTRSYLSDDQTSVQVNKGQNIARYILDWVHWNYYLVLHHLPMGSFYRACGEHFDRNPPFTSLLMDEQLCAYIIRQQERQERQDRQEELGEEQEWTDDDE